MKLFSSLFVRVFVAFFVGVFANSAALMIAERALKRPGDNHWLGDARSQQTDAIGRLGNALADAKGADAVVEALDDGDDRVVISLWDDVFPSSHSLTEKDQVAREILEEAAKSPLSPMRFGADRFMVAKLVRVGDRNVTVFVDDHTVDPPNPMHNPYVSGGLVLCVSGAVCFALAKSVTMPMKRLSRVVDRYGQGDLDARYGRVRWRDEVADLGVRFDEMANRIQGLIDSQRRLLRDVSHELRSPLTRLQLALGIARNEPKEYVASLDRVELEANRLNDMIGELLMLSRLEAPSVEQWEDADLGQVLQSIVDDAQFVAETRGVKVSLQADQPAVVHANINLLYRALDNLVRNAVKYTALNTAVEVRLLRAARTATVEYAVVEIRDHGPGIPSDELASVLRPFVRSTRTEETNGVGLGLSIAERVIQQLQGSMQLENDPAGGLRATVRLPLTSSEKI